LLHLSTKLIALCVSCFLLQAQSQSLTGHLESIRLNQKVRVCIWPDYYGITFRNPKTQLLEGVDAEMALELGKDLGVGVEFVDSNFAQLITDLTVHKCDIYAITTRTNRLIKTWADIDKPGVVVAVMKGTLHEPVMRERLKLATLKVVDTPMAREQEVSSGRADVFMTDYPYSRRMLETTDWARLVSPINTYHETKYAYAVAFGDEKWAERVDEFVRQIQRDGRLLRAATRYKLDAIVVKR
jgi:ABC-type amino acid transport substrate-binding protein